MAESILRLRVQSDEYDNKLKKAAEGIRHLADVAHKGGGELTGLEKAEIDYIKALGEMETKSRSAAGSTRELENAFKELTVIYNNLNDVEKADEGGKALAASLETLKKRAQDAKKELNDITTELNGKESGGGLFGGDKLDGMLQVFGGNLMTKGVSMVAGAAMSMANEIGDAVKQGIELAKAGEGVRIAFERLGRGDILQGLREATHGTVTDLELMKAAVKFNDFKLPVGELGTMLAFAQQKAKDTGQSVDYLVESIVTGLGRKSLMILDNLGLSAAEIKEKMAETGDMTKAVGEIIREQMAKAGDYVETAADRAAQANVSLQNKMEELGRKFAPVEEASNQLWTSIKIGILDIIGGPLATLLNQLTEAGRLKNMLTNMSGGVGGSGNSKVENQIRKLQLAKANNSNYMMRDLYSSTVEDYNRQIMKANDMLKEYQKSGWAGGAVLNRATREFGVNVHGEEDLNNIIISLQSMRDEYKRAAKEIMQPTKVNIDTKGAEQNIESLNVKLIELEAQRKKAIASGDTDLSKNLLKQINQVKSDIKGLNGGGSISTKKLTVNPIEGSIDAQTKKVQDLQKAWRAAADDTSREEIKKQIDEAQFALDKILGKVKERPKMEAVEMKLPEGGIGSLIQDTFTRQQQGLTELKQKVKLELDQEALKADTNTLQTILKDAIQNGIAGMDFQLMGIGDEIAKGFNIPDEKWNEIIEQYNAKLKEKGLGPLNIDLATGKMDTNKGVKASDDLSKMNQDVSKMSSSINGIFSGIQQMGFDIPEGMSQMLGALQGMTTIMTTITAILSVIEATTSVTAATSAVKSIPVIGWALAHGGIVHAAEGYQIPGNHMSGDMVPAMVNSGELVLNKAQQGNLASQLQDNERGGGYTPSHVSGEQIWIALNNFTRRTGRGELVTWK